ncbi:hypothetical protein UFOVP1601_28 [uncultured Caudovirales phage]|uniref:Uncharacterized protein n=1 Tax=uncultured Caudovirales phage TaxID=2100421 RepID=A0A6J5SW13_9CAUD|nr:hypothetical protein UFOVP1154_38 [uncultured Caudovirales phage]CAB4200683.1 hypothetical protein UFOVP1341_55 [uncultured Caudovirales phage]CAB4218607.1 hypothetical protein UFOVP1601_28 [uncultured Caudovirales phage]
MTPTPFVLFFLWLGACYFLWSGWVLFLLWRKGAR